MKLPYKRKQGQMSESFQVREHVRCLESRTWRGYGNPATFRVPCPVRLFHLAVSELLCVYISFIIKQWCSKENVFLSSVSCLSKLIKPKEKVVGTSSLHTARTWVWRPKLEGSLGPPVCSWLVRSTNNSLILRLEFVQGRKWGADLKYWTFNLGKLTLSPGSVRTERDSQTPRWCPKGAVHCWKSYFP